METEARRSTGAHFVLVDKHKRAIRTGWPETPATEAEVKAHRRKGGNIAFIPARNAPPLVVVDLDIPKTGAPVTEKWAEERIAEVIAILGAPLAITRTPSGGAHLMYRGTGNEPNSQWLHGDIRGAKGYAVIWDWKAYHAAARSAPKAQPVNVGRLPKRAKAKTEFTTPDSAAGMDQIAGAAAHLASLTENRNNALNTAAWHLGMSGCDRDASEAALREACERDGNGLIADDGESRFTATFRSGFDAGATQHSILEGTPRGESEVDVAHAFAGAHPEFGYHPTLGWMRRKGGEGGIWERGRRHDARMAMRAFAEDYAPPYTESPKARSARNRMLRASSIAGAFSIAETVNSLLGEFDADPHLAGLPNGKIVDLRTGHGRPGTRDDRVSRALGAVPMKMPTPEWDKFVTHLFPAPAQRKFIQRFAGYMLTGESRHHYFLFIQGAGGSGKSTLLSVLRSMAGDYHQVLPQDALTRPQEDHPVWKAKLAGARLATVGDLPVGTWKEERIKELIGEDEGVITARFMRRDPFEFRPQAKLVIAGEHKPTLRQVNAGFQRRMILVPTKAVPEKDRDPALPQKLKAELPGILTWALEGAREYFEDSQSLGEIPGEWKAAAGDYYSEQDTIEAWFAECIELDSAGFMSGPDLCKSYNAHANADMKRATRINEWLDERGYGVPKTKTGGVRGRGGIRAKDIDVTDF